MFASALSIQFSVFQVDSSNVCVPCFVLPGFLFVRTRSRQPTILPTTEHYVRGGLAFLANRFFTIAICLDIQFTSDSFLLQVEPILFPLICCLLYEYGHVSIFGGTGPGKAGKKGFMFMERWALDLHP